MKHASSEDVLRNMGTARALVLMRKKEADNIFEIHNGERGL